MSAHVFFSSLPVAFFLLAISQLESDVAFLKIVFTVWYEGARALHWKQVLCSGTDDQYSLCGGLKGGQWETLPCRLQTVV